MKGKIYSIQAVILRTILNISSYTFEYNMETAYQLRFNMSCRQMTIFTYITSHHRLSVYYIIYPTSFNFQQKRKLVYFEQNLTVYNLPTH